MDSTGVYWIPAFEILEQHGFEVILVNARYAKNVPGRKTDVNDATWLRQLHPMVCCAEAFGRMHRLQHCVHICCRFSWDFDPFFRLVVIHLRRIKWLSDNSLRRVSRLKRVGKAD
ncbi:IS110 family transposase [Agrobacterium tumefaciens]|uniref:IS110 family transposase n=1 Tax=Agrobacterium tumefaciens TaxID=358 RepID=UPI003BA20219